MKLKFKILLRLLIDKYRLYYSPIKTKMVDALTCISRHGGVVAVTSSLVSATGASGVGCLTGQGQDG